MKIAGSYLLLVALVPLASATVIDFSTVPTGNNPNPLVLAGATFTTAGGGFNYITPFSGMNTICPSSSSVSPANCPDNLEVQFATASSGVSFMFSANNDNISWHCEFNCPRYKLDYL